MKYRSSRSDVRPWLGPLSPFSVLVWVSLLTQAAGGGGQQVSQGPVRSVCPVQPLNVRAAECPCALPRHSAAQTQAQFPWSHSHVGSPGAKLSEGVWGQQASLRPCLPSPSLSAAGAGASLFMRISASMSHQPISHAAGTSPGWGHRGLLSFGSRHPGQLSNSHSCWAALV